MNYTKLGRKFGTAESSPEMSCGHEAVRCGYCHGVICAAMKKTHRASCTVPQRKGSKR